MLQGVNPAECTYTAEAFSHLPVAMGEVLTRAHVIHGIIFHRHVPGGTFYLLLRKCVTKYKCRYPLGERKGTFKHCKFLKTELARGKTSVTVRVPMALILFKDLFRSSGISFLYHKR